MRMAGQWDRHAEVGKVKGRVSNGCTCNLDLGRLTSPALDTQTSRFARVETLRALTYRAGAATALDVLVT